MKTRGLGVVLLLAVALLHGCGRWRGWVGRSSLERGARLFTQKGCHGCHTLGAMGTPIAPDLAHIGAKHTRDYLEGWLRDPTVFCPSHMPRVDMTEEELQALADYLASLR